ncbi:aminoacyl-tRNA hydrolase [Paenibacillus sp. XY044]|uniref:aminoacyl-tRNA hydrolase n=1 Tax=Paenibacillus sp. XY044 TaxID=2026089 RepID=UPI00211B3F90|nr:aminoacyl-tRNA hydrolase [Paenibacillus sp. XY044]
MKNEIVQYFVVNKELNMSPGKIAAQVAHVATNITHNDNETRLWSEWYANDQPKIILRGKERDLLKLIEQGWYYIRDNGRTEIPENSLTVVGCAPNYKSELHKQVKRFQLL